MISNILKMTTFFPCREAFLRPITFSRVHLRGRYAPSSIRSYLMAFPLTPTTTIGHRVMENMLLQNLMNQTCSTSALRMSTMLLMATTKRIAGIEELRVMGTVDLPTGARTAISISDKLMVAIVRKVMGDKVRGEMAVVAEVMIAGRTNVIGRCPQLSLRPVTVRTKKVKKRPRGTLRINHIQLRHRRFLPLETMFRSRKAFLQRYGLSGRFENRYAMKRMSAGDCAPCVDSNNSPNSPIDNKRPRRHCQTKLCGTIRR